MSQSVDKTYVVNLEITRAVTVVIQAKTQLEARSKANNLDYRHEVVGEVTRWKVLKIEEECFEN